MPKPQPKPKSRLTLPYRCPLCCGACSTLYDAPFVGAVCPDCDELVRDVRHTAAVTRLIKVRTFTDSGLDPDGAPVSDPSTDHDNCLHLDGQDHCPPAYLDAFNSLLF